MSTMPKLGGPVGMLLVLAVALGGPGCSRFEPIDADGDVTETPDEGGEDTKVDDVAEVDTAPDVAPDVVPDVAGDADAEVPDVPGDVDAETPDVPDGDDADVVTCTSECESAGDSRCDPSDDARIETCTKDAETGCLSWVPTTTCTSSDLCKGPFVCQLLAGVAQCAELVDEAPPPCANISGNPCLPHVCNPSNGQCEPKPLDVDAACDDGDKCTLGEVCSSSLECVTDILDTINCSCQVAADCEKHDDGNKCNGVYACINGTCIMGDPAPPCTLHPDPCLQNACDPPTGQCVPVPGADGVTCDDGDKCSTASACLEGVCEGTTFKDCPAGVCQAPLCDAVTGACSTQTLNNCCGNAVAEGAEQCDDGNAVTTDVCLPTCELSGCVMQAIGFDGDGCLLVPGGLALGTGNLTIELLVKPATVNQEAVLFDAMDGEAPDQGWQLVYSKGVGSVASLKWLERTTDDLTGISTGPGLDPTQWRHVALVRNGTTGKIDWYFNGVLQSGSVTIPGAQALGQTDLYIGCDGDGGGLFSGLIDEVRISKVARYSGNFSPPAVAFDPDADTLALYHFDDTRPGLTPDQGAKAPAARWLGTVGVSDHGFTGKPLAKAVCLVTPCHRSALDFVPLDQGVATVANPSVLNFQQNVTVEFWAKLRSNTKSTLISRSTSLPGGADWHIEVTAGLTNKARLRWVEAQVTTDFAVSTVATADVATPTWHHFAVTRTYDPSTQTATVVWFVDGKKETAQTITGAKAFTTTQDLYVGSQAGTTSFYDGLIDELRISKGSLYTTDFVPPAEVEMRSDTLVLYHFDEGTLGFAYPAWGNVAPPAFLLGASWSTDQPAALAKCP